MAISGYEYERLIVQTLVELSERRHIKAAPLARSAWPEHADGATKWRKIRNSEPPQELSVRDAYALAKALGVSMVELCGLVAGKELGLGVFQTQDSPGGVKIPPAKRGRQKRLADRQDATLPGQEPFIK